MNLQEAYSILDLPPGTSADAAKKKYRELTKKYHPDVNKESDAEDKFKKINEAYQIVSTGEDTERKPNAPYPWSNRQAPQRVDNIELNKTISFKESVIGSKADLKYTRVVKCATCNGMRVVPQNNGCDRCGGFGVIEGRQGNMYFRSTCDKCHGRVQGKPCTDCRSTGSMSVETSVTVSIPGGIQNGMTLRLAGMGNFAGTFMGMEQMDQYTNVNLKVHVIEELGLKLEGANVISKIDISLLEALTGCYKKVNTINGIKDITIVAGTKNKEEVILPNLGVNGSGNQTVTINVEYPKDTEALIEALKKEIL
jgi:molecular chaperone DnaJ